MSASWLPNTESSAFDWANWLDAREDEILEWPEHGGRERPPVGVQFPHLRRLWQEVLL
jgi:hypothetical protein